MSATSQCGAAAQRRGVNADVDVNAEIEKLLGEPTHLEANGKRGVSNNGHGIRMIGGRMRRFTESAALSGGRHSVIHENGEWKVGDVGEPEATGDQAAQKRTSSGDARDPKVGKASGLVKTERLPFGKNSKHSRTGLRGLAKKGGAGGKCVWGKPGCELQAQFDPAALDAGDPNYDSESDDDSCFGETKSKGKARLNVAPQLTDDALVSRIESVLKEYFRHANMDDCIESLGEIPYGKYFVGQAICEDARSTSSGPNSPVVDVPTRSEDLQPSPSPSDSGYALSLDSGCAMVRERGTTRDRFVELFGEAPKSKRYLLVREALVLAFERHSTDRELVSQLLAELSNQGHLFYIDLACGFDSVLNDLSDLRTDCPDAPKWTGMFIARAIDDQILEANFMEAFRKRSRSPAMTLALETCVNLLGLRKRNSSTTDRSRLDSDSGNGSTRLSTASKSGSNYNSKTSLNSTSSLSNVWGVGGASRPVDSLVRGMRLLVDEFLVADDFDEAIRCVRELDVPHFHHELVYQAVLVVLESAHAPASGAHVAARMCALLRRFVECGVLPLGELDTGFRRLVAALPDLELDVPRAVTAFEQFAALCEHQSLVPRSVLKDLARIKGGRKRFMSEADVPLLRG